MKKTNQVVEIPLCGLHCADCALDLEKALARMKGVHQARVNLAKARLTVEISQGEVDMTSLEKELKRHGVTPAREQSLSQDSFLVRGMDCDGEVKAIEKRLEAMEGISSFEVNLATGRLQVTFDPGVLSTSDITAAIGQLGMEAVAQGEGAPEPAYLGQRGKIALTSLGGFLTLVAFILSLLGLSRGVTVPLYLVATASAGLYVAASGIRAALRLRLDMNFLMTIAVVGAAAIGEWAEGATVAFLFSLAQLLESYTINRARQAIGRLMEISPAVAQVKRDGRMVTVPVDEVQVGNIIVTKPGERIPLDGEVEQGSSEVNQAPITGESIPVGKGPGDQVFAGSINGAGSLEIRVSRLASDSTLARIIHMVEEAQARRAPAQRFVDRFAHYYTPGVIAAAVAVAVVPPVLFGAPFALWFYRALVLLVISCPCALVISTPVSVVSALSAAARCGVLIKGGAYLEAAGRLKAIALDKTGTLTKGVAHLLEVVPFHYDGVGISQEEAVALAAAIETRSEHHLAKAIVRDAASRGISYPEVTNFQALVGQGARAELNGQTLYLGNARLFEQLGVKVAQAEEKVDQAQKEGKITVFLGTEQKLLAALILADTSRDNAREAIGQLHNCGIKRIVMLTGDNPHTAAAIAQQLGIDDYQASLLPEDKVRVVEELVAREGGVAMVGDGINDAPALAAATVGIAMGTAGTDAALETADIALMADDLSKLSFTVRLSRKALSVIKTNVALSIVVKAIFFFLALAGLATLWMAVAADMGTSLLVIGNALRLLKAPGAA